jgi:hypothetical protein
VYPLAELIVTVDVPTAPGAMVTDVAAIEYTVFVTVIEAVPDPLV